jgi:hypothetical protein
LNDAADRTDRFDQTPERAEQPKEHEQTRHVTRYVARFIKPSGDRIENAAHHLRRDGHVAGTATQYRRHRRQKHRLPLDCMVRIREAETVDPGDLGIEPQYLPQRQRDTDCKDQNNQAVQGGIGHERDFDPLVQDKDDRAAKPDKDQHSQKKDVRR